MQSLEAFLSEHGVDEHTSLGEVHRLKAIHRRQYRREYNRALYREKKAVRFFLTPEEQRKVDRAARYHHMKRATFAKAALMAYLDRVFVLPSDETVRSLELGIRRIAGSINQIARRVNTRRALEHSDVDEVNHFLTDLEGLISQAFRTPPDLLELVEQGMEKAPHLAGPLRYLLDMHRPAT